MRKIFVLDTNILLHNANAIFTFGDNDVVIPAIVWEELDSKKRLMDEVGRNAREFTRHYKDLRKRGDISKGILLDEKNKKGGKIRVELNHSSFERIKNIFPEVSNDNRILAVAINLAADPKNKKRKVVLVSNDGLLIAKADSLADGLKKQGIANFIAELYESDRMIDDADRIHKGYHDLVVPNHLIQQVYREGYIPFNDMVNRLVKDPEKLYNATFEQIKERLAKEGYYFQDFFKLIDEYDLGEKPKPQAFVRLIKHPHTGKIQFQGFQLDHDQKMWGIKGKNLEQRMFMELLTDDSVGFVFAIGGAGTGKTLLALATALKQTVDDGLYSKILVARPIIPMGKDLGALPGEKEDKLRPWIQPIYDNLEFLFDTDKDKGKKKATKEEKVRSMEKKKNGEKKQTIDDILEQLGCIEIEALTYIRGRSIPDQLIIVDECQNLTSHEVRTILSRVGEGSKVILLGDPHQIDHPYLDASNNGLVYAIERLKTEEEVGIIQLTKTERSTLADKAVKFL